MNETVSFRMKRLTGFGVRTEMNLWCIGMETVGVFRGQESRHLRQLPIIRVTRTSPHWHPYAPLMFPLGVISQRGAAGQSIAWPK